MLFGQVWKDYVNYCSERFTSRGRDSGEFMFKFLRWDWVVSFILLPSIFSHSRTGVLQLQTRKGPPVVSEQLDSTFDVSSKTLLTQSTYICIYVCHLTMFKLVEKTRTNWPRKVRELILDSDSWSQGVKGYAFWVPGGQRVGFHGRRGSRGRPTGSQGVKG